MREYIAKYDGKRHRVTTQELIRCKDCRFFHPRKHINETYCTCEVGMVEPYDKGYCSYAERKGEQE